VFWGEKTRKIYFGTLESDLQGEGLRILRGDRGNVSCVGGKKEKKSFLVH